jgi:hypothetical protein
MMDFCGRKVVFVLCVIMGWALLQGAFAPVAAQPYAEKTEGRVKIGLDYPGLGIQDTVTLYGPVDLKWLEPYPSPLFPPHFELDGEIDTCRLNNPTGSWAWNPPYRPLISKGYLLDPEPWVESFFDITFEMKIPEHFPGDTLTMNVPVRTYGIAHGWPPLYDAFATPEGMPPSPLQSLDGTTVAFITSIELELYPHYDPEVHLSVSTAYGSEVAIVSEDGTIHMSAGLSGDYEATEAIFGYRPCGAPGPFMPFHVDMDGSAPGFSTIRPEGTGDGWSAHFDPGSDPFEGQCVQFEAALLVPPFGYFRDTVEVWVDPTPPIPSFFDIHRDSVAVFQIDSFFDITFKLDDELPGPGLSELLMFPLQVDFERTLTPIDQLGLGTDRDSVSCGPTAAASCLKYFADNGYPGLDNVGGDVLKPEQSGEDMARELQGAMGTNDSTGATPDGMVAGISSYLQGHGQSGWSVEAHPVDDATDLAEMLREFESDSEDVIVLLEDTTAAGDTTGHAVTLGSTHRTDPSTPGGTPEMSIDFMDPWEGGSQADNEYPLDTIGGGRPTTDGYDLDGAGGDAKIAGYIKVSPPSSGSPSPPIARSALATTRAPWLLVSSGPVRGNGLVDTLRLDTTPLAGGLYLMEVVTTDDQGFRCRDIRLAAIPTYTVDGDLPDPGSRTMLRGSYPNPFNPTTTIEFYLARGAKVTLAIYDVSGRRVRTLLSDAMTEAGVHRVGWNGKDDAGRKLASGVYFAHFRAEGQIASRKLILLR